MPLKPLSQMNWNLIGSIYGRPSLLISSRSVSKHGRHSVSACQKKKKEIYNDKYRHTRDRLFGLHLYLSATLKQCFTEFAICRTTFHHVDMSVRGRIPTCDFIGRLFLGSGLKINTFFAILTLLKTRPIKSHVGIRPRTDISTWWKVVLQTANSVKHLL
jgi:hypothetical protein